MANLVIAAEPLSLSDPELLPTVCIWALHFLSTSEDVQDKLCQEVEDLFGSDPVSLEKIPQLK